MTSGRSLPGSSVIVPARSLLPTCAGEILEAEAAVRVIEPAGDVIGGRLGDRDAGERIQERHVRPGEIELQVGALEVQGVADRADEMHMGRAVRDREVDRIGLALVAQREQGAADQPAGDGLVGIGALRLDDELRGFGCAAALPGRCYRRPPARRRPPGSRAAFPRRARLPPLPWGPVSEPCGAPGRSRPRCPAGRAAPAGPAGSGRSGRWPPDLRIAAVAGAGGWARRCRRGGGRRRVRGRLLARRDRRDRQMGPGIRGGGTRARGAGARPRACRSPAGNPPSAWGSPHGPARR